MQLFHKFHHSISWIESRMETARWKWLATMIDVLDYLILSTQFNGNKKLLKKNFEILKVTLIL